jgi:hypothetical protein
MSVRRKGRIEGFEARDITYLLVADSVVGVVRGEGVPILEVFAFD